MNTMSPARSSSRGWPQRGSFSSALHQRDHLLQRSIGIGQRHHHGLVRTRPATAAPPGLRDGRGRTAGRRPVRLRLHGAVVAGERVGRHRPGRSPWPGASAMVMRWSARAAPPRHPAPGAATSRAQASAGKLQRAVVAVPGASLRTRGASPPSKAESRSRRGVGFICTNCNQF